MFNLKHLIVILSIFALKYVQSENLTTITSDIISTSPALPKENDINSSTLENITTSSSSSLPFATSPSSILNDLNVVDTTPSWELIYPDKNSTGNSMTSSTSSSYPSTTNTDLISTVLPKYFKVDDVTNCQKYFGVCLKQVLANVIPKLKDGNKALNIPSLDPIYFNQTAFQYNSGPFSGYITVRYALIYGLTSMKFKKIDFDKSLGNKFQTRLSIVVPKMEAIGSYKGDMQVNSVRAMPRGNFNVTMKGVGLDVICSGLIFNKDEHTFLKLTKSNVTTSLKDSKITATGIFPDQRLNEIVVNVANQYRRDLLNIVLAETKNYWSPILLDALNGALAMVPFDFLSKM